MRSWFIVGLAGSICGCGSAEGGDRRDNEVPIAVPAPSLPGSPVPGSPVPGSPVPGSPVPGSPVPGSPDEAPPATSAGTPVIVADPGVVGTLTPPSDVVARAALPLYGLGADGELAEAELWETLASFPVVCFGETHDDAAHHFAQTRAISELAARAMGSGLLLGVGFEMFQTPFQTVISSFAAGSIDERQLLEGSDYVARWGYDFAYYRPLLELVRKFMLPALALNAPVELTRRIGDVGLEGLSPEERARLPELDLEDPVHRGYVEALLGAAHGAEASFEKPYSVQVVWDETMAETASAWLTSTGDTARLIIIAGSGHCHHSAIPARITRRTGLPVLAVSPVLASRLESPGHPTLELYDTLVVLDDRR
jgi:uncharacterized iron-regulated protein